MKKIMIPMLLAFALLLPMQAFAASDIRVYIDNKEIQFDQPPVIENGRTLVPARFILEPLGLDISYDENERKVTAEGNGKRIVMFIGEDRAWVDGFETPLDVSSKVMGERIMVPLRFLAETMKFTVEWNDYERIVTIYTPGGGMNVPASPKDPETPAKSTTPPSGSKTPEVPVPPETPSYTTTFYSENPNVPDFGADAGISPYETKIIEKDFFDVYGIKPVIKYYDRNTAESFADKYAKTLTANGYYRQNQMEEGGRVYFTNGNTCITMQNVDINNRGTFFVAFSTGKENPIRPAIILDPPDQDRGYFSDNTRVPYFATDYLVRAFHYRIYYQKDNYPVYYYMFSERDVNSDSRDNYNVTLGNAGFGRTTDQKFMDEDDKGYFFERGTTKIRLMGYDILDSVTSGISVMFWEVP